MNGSIDLLVNRIRSVLFDEEPTVVLYGSCAMGDFQLGWSDIDLLVLTKQDLREDQAQTLVGMRQTLQTEFPNNPYFRAFEGHICSIDALQNGGTVVYWGTSGQRIKQKCDLDPFTMLSITDYSRIICGEDLRGLIARPTQQEILDAIRFHLQAIREHGSKTGQSLYSAGWILDIARCLYTLETGKIIGKTQAGEWAIANGCAGDLDVMRRALEVRRNPLWATKDSETMKWLGGLGPKIQQYADVLEEKIKSCP